jgi:hypothetical protein
MKNLIFAALIAISASNALADDETPIIRNSLDETACDESGQCVVFEVTIHMKAVASVPVVNVANNNVITINNTANLYGTTVRRVADTCTKQVRVPKEVFKAIISIMKSLSGANGQQPAFTPAQQTMLLFYTTLMQQTLQFECTIGDLTGGN